MIRCRASKRHRRRMGYTPRPRRLAYDGRMTTRAPVLAADVVVVGGGNAGLAAALAAREAGASALILEKAPRHLRGGNTYFTGGLFRFAYDGWDEIAQLIPDTSEQERAAVDVGAYPVAAFYDDVMRVTEGWPTRSSPTSSSRGRSPP